MIAREDDIAVSLPKWDRHAKRGVCSKNKAKQSKANSGVNAQMQCAQVHRSDHGRRGSSQKDVGAGPADARSRMQQKFRDRSELGMSRGANKVGKTRG